MELKYIEMLEKAVEKMKLENSPYLTQFPNLVKIEFDKVKSGEKQLSDYIPDEKLNQIATKLNISTEGKDRDALVQEIAEVIKTRAKAKVGFLSKLNFFKKKN